jgi:hypothetical protein
MACCTCWILCMFQTLIFVGFVTRERNTCDILRHVRTALLAWRNMRSAWVWPDQRWTRRRCLAWLSMAQHAAVSVLFRCTWDLVCAFSSEKKKQGSDEQPLNIDRTKDNIRWNFVFLTQSAISIGFRDRRRCQVSQMLATPNHETVTRLTKGSGAAMLCRARISCWLHWAIVWSYKVQCT